MTERRRNRCIEAMNGGLPPAGCALPWRPGILFLAAIAFVLGAGCGARRGADLLEKGPATIAELQEAMESGSLTAESITSFYLRRIEAVDGAGPTLRSILAVNPAALESARALDRERAATGPRGPLHGIPVLLKDNIDTGDMATTAGSWALKDSVPLQDAFVVDKLRAAGVVILGKTNLSEWANFRSRRSSSGWSGLGGQTRNPYVLDRNPCGSSSGSAVAIAANLGAVSLGTETDGSIICPSSINGIVGIKPTVGLASRSGIIPISHTQDTAGPMVRTVADAATLLGAMTGIDPADPATEASRDRVFADYRQFLLADGLRGARIGVPRNLMGAHEKIDAVMEAALAKMRELGATIVEIPEMQRPVGADELLVLYYEFKADLNAYLAKLRPEVAVKTLAELIAFNEENRDKEMPFFEQEHFVAAQAKGGLDTLEYVQARERNLTAAQAGIDNALTNYDPARTDEPPLDALVAPSRIPAWPTDLVNGDHAFGGTSSPAAVAGYPSITVPMGDVFGLPVGISFIGTAFSEPVLIKLAYAFEQATGHRREPTFLPTLVLDRDGSDGASAAAQTLGVDRAAGALGDVAAGGEQ